MPGSVKALIIVGVVLALIIGGLFYARSRVAIVGELMAFLAARKLWWMMPIVIVFLLLGVLILLTQQSAIAPFIYTLF